MKIFIDETAWMHLIVKEHRFHEKFKEVFEMALDAGDRLFTHNIAVGMALSGIRQSLGSDIAGKFNEIIDNACVGSHLSVLWIGRRTQKEATRIMRNHPEIALNLYDFAGYVLASRRRIQTILATKDEYQKLGLKVIPEAEEINL